MQHREMNNRWCWAMLSCHGQGWRQGWLRGGLGWAGLDWYNAVTTAVLTRIFFTADAAALLLDIFCTLYLQKGA